MLAGLPFRDGQPDVPSEGGLFMQLLTKVRSNLPGNMVIILFAGLALLSSASSFSPDAAVVSSASTSKKEIIYEFNETLNRNVLPDRNKFFN